MNSLRLRNKNKHPLVDEVVTLRLFTYACHYDAVDGLLSPAISFPTYYKRRAGGGRLVLKVEQQP